MTRDNRIPVSVPRHPTIEKPRDDWSDGDTLTALDREAASLNAPPRRADESLREFAVRLAAFRLKRMRKS